MLFFMPMRGTKNRESYSAYMTCDFDSLGIDPRKRGAKAIPGVTLDEAGNVVDYDLEIQCP
jgi:hypothetical protein